MKVCLRYVYIRIIPIYLCSCLCRLVFLHMCGLLDMNGIIKFRRLFKWIVSAISILSFGENPNIRWDVIWGTLDGIQIDNTYDEVEAHG